VACCDVYQLAAERARREHIPAVIHVTEMTQPQGHSTSGSHERYKSKDRSALRSNSTRSAACASGSFARRSRTPRRLISSSEASQPMWNDPRGSVEAYLAPIRADREQALAILEAVAADGDADLERLWTSCGRPTRRPASYRVDSASSARRAPRP